VNGVPRGPGFVLWNTDLTVTPQHTVTVNGKIGETNLTLGSNGLPLTAAELRAQNKPLETESSARYADFALSGGELTVTAGGNIYLGRVRDAGLVGGMDAQGNPRDPAFAAGLEHNKATFISRDGNIIINTNSLDAGRQGSPLEVLSTLLPASFEARADMGTIQIRSNLKFLPHRRGDVFRASRHSGRAKIGRGDDPNFIWLFVGYGGISGGSGSQSISGPSLSDRIMAVLVEHAGKQHLAENSGRSTFHIPDYAKKDTDRTPPPSSFWKSIPTISSATRRWTRWSLVTIIFPSRRITRRRRRQSVSRRSWEYQHAFLDLVSRPFRKEISIERETGSKNSAPIFICRPWHPNADSNGTVPSSSIRARAAAPITSKDVILIRDPTTGLVGRGIRPKRWILPTS
jgi:hypothetical protein